MLKWHFREKRSIEDPSHLREFYFLGVLLT